MQSLREPLVWSHHLKQLLLGTWNLLQYPIPALLQVLGTVTTRVTGAEKICCFSVWWRLITRGQHIAPEGLVRSSENVVKLFTFGRSNTVYKCLAKACCTCWCDIRLFWISSAYLSCFPFPPSLCETVWNRLIESMMGLRPRQGNLRLVFRLFSLMRGLPSIRLK